MLITAAGMSATMFLFSPSISPVSLFPLFLLSLPSPSFSFFTPDANYLLLNRAILTKPLLFLFNDTRARYTRSRRSRNVCTRGALLFNENTRSPYRNVFLFAGSVFS